MLDVSEVRCHGCEMFNGQHAQACMKNSSISRHAPCSLWRGSKIYDTDASLDMWFTTDSIDFCTNISQSHFQMVHMKASRSSITARPFIESVHKLKGRAWGFQPLNGTYLLLPSGSQPNQFTIDQMRLERKTGPFQFVFISNKKRFFMVNGHQAHDSHKIAMSLMTDAAGGSSSGDGTHGNGIFADPSGCAEAGRVAGSSTAATAPTLLPSDNYYLQPFVACDMFGGFAVDDPTLLPLNSSMGGMAAAQSDPDLSGPLEAGSFGHHRKRPRAGNDDGRGSGAGLADIKAHHVLVQMADQTERRLPAVLALMQEDIVAVSSAGAGAGASAAAPVHAHVSEGATRHPSDTVVDSRGDVGYWFERASGASAPFDTGDIVELRDGLLSTPVVSPDHVFAQGAVYLVVSDDCVKWRGPTPAAQGKNHSDGHWCAWCGVVPVRILGHIVAGAYVQANGGGCFGVSSLRNQLGVVGVALEGSQKGAMVSTVNVGVSFGMGGNAAPALIPAPPASPTMTEKMSELISKLYSEAEENEARQEVVLRRARIGTVFGVVPLCLIFAALLGWWELHKKKRDDWKPLSSIFSFLLLFPLFLFMLIHYGAKQRSKTLLQIHYSASCCMCCGSIFFVQRVLQRFFEAGLKCEVFSEQSRGIASCRELMGWGITMLSGCSLGSIVAAAVGWNSYNAYRLLVMSPVLVFGREVMGASTPALVQPQQVRGHQANQVVPEVLTEAGGTQ
jgi:hypothetical protein